jgi:hypothetical protein
MFVLITFASCKHLEIFYIGPRRAGGEYNRQRWESFKHHHPYHPCHFFSMASVLWLFSYRGLVIEVTALVALIPLVSLASCSLLPILLLKRVDGMGRWKDLWWAPLVTMWSVYEFIKDAFFREGPGCG